MFDDSLKRGWLFYPVVKLVKEARVQNHFYPDFKPLLLSKFVENLAEFAEIRGNPKSLPKLLIGD